MTPAALRTAVVLLPGALVACSQAQQVLPGQAYHATFEGRFIDQLEPPARVTEVGAKAPDSKALSGDAAKLSLLDVEGLVEAPAFEAYLEDVLARALEGYPFEPVPVRISIEASSRAMAWATPENRIFVTLGLLENLETEGQLATALAHEAGHVQLRHFAREDYLDSQRQAVTAGAGLAMVGVAVANTRVRERGDEYRLANTDPEETEENVAKLALARWLINGVSDQVVNGHWTRRQEEEADLFATDLIIDAGYDPRAPASLFQLLGRLWGQEQDFGAFLEAEQERASKELEALGGPVEAFEAAPARFVEIGLNAAKEAWRRMGSTHLSPEERQAAMLEYVRREYRGRRLEAAERQAEAERYRSALAAKLPEAVRARYRAASEAQRLLLEDKLAQAEDKARFAITGPTSDSAHTRAVMYMVRKAQGRHDDALANLERIGAGEFRPKRVFEFLAAEYLQRRRPEAALRVLDTAADQFGTDEPFLPSRIEVLLAMDRIEDARAVHERCRSAASPAIRGACDAVIEGVPQVAEAETAPTEGLSGVLEEVDTFFQGVMPAAGPE